MKRYQISAVDIPPKRITDESIVCLSREKADESEKESNMISEEKSAYKRGKTPTICSLFHHKITFYFKILQVYHYKK